MRAPTGARIEQDGLVCRATGERCFSSEEATVRSRSDVLATAFRCAACGAWHVDRVLLGVPRSTEVL
jgi:hypothetical protein